VIHVIIPVHNRLKYTQACIESLKKQNLFEKLNIIVVDDGSTDDTKSYIKNYYPEITILKGNGNLFWGGAINFGINYVLKIGKIKDWILLVNNDVELAPDSICKLVNESEIRNRKILAGSLTINFEDKSTIIKSGTIVKSWFFNKTEHVYNNLDVNKLSNHNNIEVNFMTGRSLLHPIEIFDKVGNYDSKNFLHYGCDDEFTMRVQKYGYKVLLCVSSLVYLKSDQNRNLTKSKKNLFHTLFSIRSSSNIVNKLKLTLKVIPFYAKLSFFFIGVLKSIYLHLKEK
jgi:GT2 family glycosyltransferase